MKRIKEFDYLKSFAVFSIVCAHLSPISVNTHINGIISWILNTVGILGVPIFFFMSGYFFYNNKKGFWDFFRDKLINIIIPWIFVGSLCYLFVFYFKHDLSILGYLKFILGYGSYLYYLLVLILLYIVSFKLKNENYYLIISSFLGIISIIFTIIFSYNKFSYINIFNWILYFNFGILLNKFKLYDNYKLFCKKYKVLFLILFLLIFNFALLRRININYWNIYGLLLIFCSGISLAGFVQLIKEDVKVLNFIGLNSLPFYLIHMPIAGIIVRLTDFNCFLIMLRPFLTIFITYVIIYLYRYIIKKVKLDTLSVLIGVK